MLDNASKHLLKTRLKIKMNKCSLFKKQIHYLGHLVSGTSILPFVDKTEGLMKLKSPTNVKEVRHFLGLTGYYHKCNCNYTDIVYPLNCLTHKAQPFIWTPECQASLNMLQLRLTNTPIVQLPDPKNLINCSLMPANFAILVCSSKHRLQTLMKHLGRYALATLPLPALNHKHRTFHFHPMPSIL